MEVPVAAAAAAAVEADGHQRRVHSAVVTSEDSDYTEEDIFPTTKTKKSDSHKGSKIGQQRRGDGRKNAKSGDGHEQEEGDDDYEDEEMYKYFPGDPGYSDDLHDANLDQEDEAYVYRHLRGGVKETVTVIRQKNYSTASRGGKTGGRQEKDNDLGEEPLDGTTTQNQDNHDTATMTMTKTKQKMQVYRPRDTDAVLSCPCCFNIVCMDCQRHQRYLNQFRAMFVMGITVDWHHRLIYDQAQQALVRKPLLPNEVPPDYYSVTANDGHERRFPPAIKGEYFAVLCANCHTHVAALDLTEEVYHFHGCLESA